MAFSALYNENTKQKEEHKTKTRKELRKNRCSFEISAFISN
jgi:hypothetical protein